MREYLQQEYNNIGNNITKSFPASWFRFFVFVFA